MSELVTNTLRATTRSVESLATQNPDAEIDATINTRHRDVELDASPEGMSVSASVEGGTVRVRKDAGSDDTEAGAFDYRIEGSSGNRVEGFAAQAEAGYTFAVGDEESIRVGAELGYDEDYGYSAAAEASVGTENVQGGASLGYHEQLGANGQGFVRARF